MFSLPPGRPALMGILNVTPDSFSDGGFHLAPEEAIRAAERMMEEGADLIDVGGESTRPGAAEVPVEEELSRVLPVVRELRRKRIPVSIDTRKPEVAKAALDLGAKVVNDVFGFRDPAMIAACSPYDCSICIMHMQGTPETMQAAPRYQNVVEDIRELLLEQVGRCIQGGINRKRIWIDPGIGFGKTVEHNLQILKGLGLMTGTDLPVLVGVSRKSFIGRILGAQDTPLRVDDRLEGTLAAQVLAQAAGARIIRTHDVKASRRAIEMAAAILKS
ncbi:MAG: dihydropteroate synthase [Fimbriimonadaceae bacterium]